MPHHPFCRQDFIKNGLIIIPPRKIGVSEKETRANFAAAQGFRRDATAGQCLSLAENRVSRIPSLSEVLRSPAVMGAVQGLLGEDLESHPHNFVHLTQPRLEQDFHKDVMQSWAGHTWRHNQPERLILMYYPQDTTEGMGPKEIWPMTQYF